MRTGRLTLYLTSDDLPNRVVYLRHSNEKVWHEYRIDGIFIRDVPLSYVGDEETPDERPTPIKTHFHKPRK
jgi:hypothetical protein